VVLKIRIWFVSEGPLEECLEEDEISEIARKMRSSSSTSSVGTVRIERNPHPFNGDEHDLCPDKYSGSSMIHCSESVSLH
jgi:hypothetical protein